MADGRTAADVVLDAIYDGRATDSPAETTERVRRYLAEEGWSVIRADRAVPSFMDGQGDEWVHITDEWTPDGAGVAAGPQATPLFQLGEFTAHSGDRLAWKVECEALTPRDWECLAAMAAEVLPPFGAVEGVPRGGLAFAEALAQHSVPGGRLLIADDVCTTGASLDEHRAGRDAIGVVAFARGPVPAWVTPVLRVVAAPTSQEPDDE